MKANQHTLTVLQEGGPEQEYALDKSTITLGRAMDNDIILSDGRVSRNHARLELTGAECYLVDQGSANGTRVNGRRVERVELQPGDLINLGNTQLRYDAARPLDATLLESGGMTMIESERDLDLSLEHESLPVAINETRTPRLVIFTGDNTWEVPLENMDALTLGRSDENQVPIDLPRVSRRHAEIVRKGDTFILRDLNSTNGTWLKGERIEQAALQDGDMFRTGQAQVVFKSGFTQQALTFAEESLFAEPRRAPVVFVPGLMGSELWLGNERIWPNVKTLFKNPEMLRFDSGLPLEPRAILDEVVIVPNLIKLDQYNRLGDFMVENLGYERGVNFFEFPYDWRQDVRISARQLGRMIENLPTQEPVILIGHSLGTMVSRYYVECLGGKERVGRAILMGGPHLGVVKAVSSLLVSAELLPFGYMGERFRQLLAGFPSSYQIIPVYAAATDQHGQPVNFLKDESWVSEAQLPLLRGGRAFRKELGRTSSIPTISIFGYGLKTITGLTIDRAPSGEIKNVTYTQEKSGDNTIPEKSTVLEGTEIHPVQQHHGSLFVDNDVKMRLKLELSKKNGWGT